MSASVSQPGVRECSPLHVSFQFTLTRSNTAIPTTLRHLCQSPLQSSRRLSLTGLWSGTRLPLAHPGHGAAVRRTRWIIGVEMLHSQLGGFGLRGSEIGTGFFLGCPQRTILSLTRYQIPTLLASVERDRNNH